VGKLIILILVFLGILLAGLDYFFFAKVMGQLREAISAQGRYQEDRVKKILSSMPVKLGEKAIRPLKKLVGSREYLLIERQFAQMALWEYRKRNRARRSAGFSELVEVTGVNLRLDVEDMEPETLLGYLDRPDPAFRIAGCRGLGLLGKKAPPSAKSLLLERLRQDSYLPVRGAAALALGEMQVTEAIPEMRKLFEEEIGPLSRAAVKGLAKFPGAEGRRALEAVLEKYPVAVSQALEERGEKEAVPALKRALSEQISARGRMAVVRTMSLLGDSEGQKLLIQSLGPGPTEIRLLALEFSHGIEIPEVLKRTVICAGSGEASLRRMAAGALGSNRSHLAAATLKALLTDPDRTVKAAAVEAIADRKDPSFGDILRGLLSDPAGDPVVIPAIRGVAALGDTTVVSLLRSRLTGNSSDALVKAAWLALRQLQGHAPEVSRRQQTLFESVRPVDLP
jgi:HEAT repeat protein